MSGNLVIKPICAKLTRDTELIGTMDPYIKIHVGSQTHVSNVHKKGGKNPTWNAVFNSHRTNEGLITFDLWEKDILSRDEFIADGSYSLDKALLNGRSSEWVPCTYKGKGCGSVLIEVEYIPDQKSQNMGQQQPLQQMPIQQFQDQSHQQMQIQPNSQLPLQHGQGQQQPMQGLQGQHQQSSEQTHQQMQPQTNMQQGQQIPVLVQQGQQEQHGQLGQHDKQGQQGQQVQHGQLGQHDQQGQFNQGLQANKAQIPIQGLQNQMGHYPTIQYNATCKKCHGTGRNLKGSPCSSCYEHAGYCKKCFGTKTDVKTRTACKKCSI